MTDPAASSPSAAAVLVTACQLVLDHARHVSLDVGWVQRMAEAAPPALLVTPDWHGTGMLESHPEDVITWLMTYNAINFCYWPEPGQRRWFTQHDGQLVGQDDEALGVMACIARAIQSGVPFHDWAWLKSMDEDELAAILAPAAGAGHLPGMEERLAALHDLAGARRLAGAPAALFEQARGSAARFVDLLIRAAPGWEDTSTYVLPDGSTVALPFRKRAWLCAAMLYGRFQRDHLRRFEDPEVIPVFSDYRLPQILRGGHVLKLDPALAARIDAHEVLAHGSPEEVEIRAATVVAADLLRQALAVRLQRRVLGLEVDHFLWGSAVSVAEQLPPFHRTRTTAY